MDMATMPSLVNKNGLDPVWEGLIRRPHLQNFPRLGLSQILFQFSQSPGFELRIMTKRQNPEQLGQIVPDHNRSSI